MLSKSMKALSESDRNSPATEKKISSRTMKPQIAPRLRIEQRVEIFDGDRPRGAGQK